MEFSTSAISGWSFWQLVYIKLVKSFSLNFSILSARSMRGYVWSIQVQHWENKDLDMKIYGQSTNGWTSFVAIA